VFALDSGAVLPAHKQKHPIPSLRLSILKKLSLNCEGLSRRQNKKRNGVENRKTAYARYEWLKISLAAGSYGWFSTYLFCIWPLRDQSVKGWGIFRFAV